MKRYIENSKDYFIDELGFVYKNNRRLKTNNATNGYSSVTIRYLNGIRKVHYVHRLVAMVFLPNPDNLPVVNHKDLNKQNNAVSNLEWVSYKDNTKHAINEGAYCDEEGTRYSAIYNKQQIIEVCELLEEGLRDVDIIRKTGVSKATVEGVRKKKMWVHLSNQYNFSHSSRKLKISVETIRWICKMIQEGKSNIEIENLVLNKQITRQDVWKIRNKQLYRMISKEYF